MSFTIQTQTKLPRQTMVTAWTIMLAAIAPDVGRNHDKYCV